MNALRALIESGEHVRTKRQCELRDGHTKKASK